MRRKVLWMLAVMVAALGATVLGVHLARPRVLINAGGIEPAGYAAPLDRDAERMWAKKALPPLGASTIGLLHGPLGTGPLCGASALWPARAQVSHAPFT